LTLATRNIQLLLKTHIEKSVDWNLQRIVAVTARKIECATSHRALAVHFFFY